MEWTCIALKPTYEEADEIRTALRKSIPNVKIRRRTDGYRVVVSGNERAAKKILATLEG